jgi:GNAT superfamily N-acetyltransferase
MKVRRATTKDIPAIVTLGKVFYDQTVYAQSGVEYDEPSIHTMLEYLVGDNGVVQVAVDGDTVVGFILILLYPFPFNPNERSATELAFYVREDAQREGMGRQLLKSAENVARQKGVKFLSMVALESVAPEKAQALYSQLGYVRNETVYTKVI